MKKEHIHIVSLIFFFSCVAHGKKTFENHKIKNKIDSISTTKEVFDFVKSIDNRFIRRGSVQMNIKSTDSMEKSLNYGSVFKKWQIKNWEKIDINDDGRMDLIFYSHYYGRYDPHLVVDNGNKGFKVHDFPIASSYLCTLIKPIKMRNKNQLRVFFYKLYEKPGNATTFHKGVIDTLTYKFDSFVELNQQKTENYKIESIAIKVGGCFGDCPSYELEMNNKEEVMYYGKDFVKYKGKSASKIPKEYFQKLVEIATYINVKNLKRNYEVEWTDSPTSQLKLKFSDGSVKEIKDYGMQGTLGLQLLYQTLYAIVSVTKWG